MKQGSSSAAGEAVALTSMALVAFAANSVLCRAALRPSGEGDAAIEPLGFTVVRLMAGALVLLPFVGRGSGWSPAGAAALVAYALGFSLAYVALPAGVGALALFGAVQVTMLVAGWRGGERPTPVRALGLAAAVAGVAWLCWPAGSSSGRVDGNAALLMLGAGVAWGVYSLLGRGAERPVVLTARNFVLAAPLSAAVAAVAVAIDVATPTWSGKGLALAVTSGALTSGLGYVVWYRALRHHSRTSAAVVQLSVPVIAALGGVALLDEAVTVRLVGASVLTLGGVAVALVGSARR